jgi:ABC-type branched-subunit amino acid transport system substrate-binding protein
MSFRARLARLAGVAVVGAALAAVLGSSGLAGGTGSQVVVPRGQPVQFAFTGDTTQAQIFTDFSESAGNAIQMAIEQHPTIRGFPIQVNSVETLCGGGDNTAPATAIVGNVQNTAVLGHFCSGGFESALPIYEAAGVVTISGSATVSSLPTLGPTVFNRTVVSETEDDPDAAEWLAQVAALPSVLAWDQEYESEFGEAPFLEPLSALYFDAASLLLKRLQKVSRIVNGNLVIDRAALAQAVRSTTKYQGVTCKITLDPATGNRLNDKAALARCAEG